MNKLKVGILTFHRAFNCGANLQAFALNSYINSIGLDCEIIDFYPNNVKRPNSNPLRRLMRLGKSVLLYNKRRAEREFSRFQKKNYRLSRQQYYGDADIAANPPQYDILISGSDQILNTTLTGNSKSYYLSFDEHAKKISYASSFGRADVSKEECLLIDTELPKFSALSVREKNGGDLIENRIGRTCKLVLDPVFLISKRGWEQQFVIPYIKGNYIFVYAMETTELLKETARRLSIEKGLPIYVMYGTKERFENFGETINEKDPIRFISLIHGASLVVTNSFHGTAFSIIFEKNFVCVPHSTRNARLENIMELSGMLNKLISVTSKAEESISDGSIAAANIAPYVKISKEYLNDVLR